MTILTWHGPRQTNSSKVIPQHVWLGGKQRKQTDLMECIVLLLVRCDIQDLTHMQHRSHSTSLFTEQYEDKSYSGFTTQHARLIIHLSAMEQYSVYSDKGRLHFVDEKAKLHSTYTLAVFFPILPKTAFNWISLHLPARRCASAHSSCHPKLAPDQCPWLYYLRSVASKFTAPDPNPLDACPGGNVGVGDLPQASWCHPKRRIIGVKLKYALHLIGTACMPHGPIDHAVKEFPKRLMACVKLSAETLWTFAVTAEF